MSVEQHQRLSRNTPLSCAVVTVSDTRTEESDASGDLIKSRLRAHGHPVEFYGFVPDDGEKSRAVLLHLVGQVEVVVTTGGTGIARRDTTIEVADRLIQKALPGFGEIFRQLSFEEIGPAAMLSRATAGLYGVEDGPAQTLLFCCPGSTDAVTLALDRLILPDLRHLVWEVVRQPLHQTPAPSPDFPL